MLHRFFSPCSLLATAFCGMWLCLSSAHAAPQLQLPLACELGRTCFIVDLYDHGRGLDPSGTPLAFDFQEGSRTSNDQYGTRFHVYNASRSDTGVNVLAAAEGVVLSVRDQLPNDPAAMGNIGTRLQTSAGNSVVIGHSDGYETQYNGLMQNSVPVKKGQKVKAGTVIGQIGGLGAHIYPTLNFVVRHHARPIDPFVGDLPEWQPTQARRPLWNIDLQDPQSMLDVGLLGSGFSDSSPTMDAVKNNHASLPELNARSPQLVYWAYFFGLKKGDQVNLSLFNPQGSLIARHEETASQDFDRYFSYVGRRAETSGLPTGVYRATVAVKRNGKELFQDLYTIRVLPLQFEQRSPY